MRATVETFLSRYGTDMVLTGVKGTRTARGFFQAVRSQSWQRTDLEASPLGEIPRGQYTYLGPSCAEAQEGDTVQVGGKEYLLRRVETYFYQNEPIYQWGMCVRKGDADHWGQ